MNLSEFFIKIPAAAVAFSGGTDSAYLLGAAKRAGADVTAYYVKSAFQPQFELEDAKRFAKETGIDMKILTADVHKILLTAVITAKGLFLRQSRRRRRRTAIKYFWTGRMPLMWRATDRGCVR